MQARREHPTSHAAAAARAAPHAAPLWQQTQGALRQPAILLVLLHDCWLEVRPQERAWGGQRLSAACKRSPAAGSGAAHNGAAPGSTGRQGPTHPCHLLEGSVGCLARARCLPPTRIDPPRRHPPGLQPPAAMNALARASKQALQTAARGFASGAYPDRKVAVLGAAGEPHSSGWVRDQCSGAELHVAATRPIAARVASLLPSAKERYGRAPTVASTAARLISDGSTHLSAGGIGQPLSLLMKVRGRAQG